MAGSRNRKKESEKKLHVTENQLHRAIADLCKSAIPYTECIWTSHEVSAGGKQGRQWDYAKRGVLTGYPDMSFIWRDEFGIVYVLFVELKAKYGRARDGQKEFRKRCSEMGFPYEICRSVEQMKEIIERYNIPHRRFGL